MQKTAANKPCCHKFKTAWQLQLLRCFFMSEFFLQGLKNSCSTSGDQEFLITGNFSQKQNRQSNAKNSAENEYNNRALYNLLTKIDFFVSHLREEISAILTREITPFALFILNT